MSPRSVRYPSPASGDDATPSGRHRRPDSLAEVVSPRQMIAVPAPRPAPRTATRSAGRSAAPARSTRHRPSTGHRPATGHRPTTGPRHSAVTPDASRRPPVAGSHRAPGILAIESWLLMGSKRQQVLLASLVAAALLLVAIPMRQNGVDAVDAAMAGAIGSHATGKQAKKHSGTPSHSVEAAADPHTSSPAPKPSTSAAAKEPATEVKLPLGQGPGHSLRTTGSKAISLTFDDGPDPVQTPKILALLAKYQIKATFCLIGQNVQKHPEIVREIVAAGHTLCDHTWNHSLTIGKDAPAKIQADLARTKAAIQAAAPGAPVPFFRAPGGNFTDRLVSVAKSEGMTSLYWAVDPRDWDHPAGETDSAHIARVIAAIHKSVQPGSIILSHDFNQPDTIEAYGKLLPWLTANFTFTIPGETAPTAPTTPVTSSPDATPTSPDATSTGAAQLAPVDPATDE
jgi:peptidoglycan/xylan/chitin deacetylase (PgdA/CDA1 family)